jgi:hypothetical protein
MICRLLADYDGGLSIEIFSLDDLATSLDRLQDTLQKKPMVSLFRPEHDQGQSTPEPLGDDRTAVILPRPG